VPLDYERGWYRYHHLFQDFLRRKSEDHLSKEGVATLHSKASAWLAGNGFIDEALRHALAAGDVEGAARVVEESRHAALNREEWATLERWLNLLPEETIQGRPILLVARAWVLDFRYQIAGIPPLLQAAEARLSADPDVWTESARDLQGEIDALWSIVLAWGGQGKPALERALRALKLLPPAYAFVRSFAMLILALAYQMTGQTDTALRVLGDFLTEADALPDTVITRMLICQAYVHIRVGNLHQAAQVLQRLQYVAEKARLTVSIFIANWLLGRISYEWNHLETASQHLPAMFELRYVGHYGMVYDGTTSLVLTYHAQGKPDKAEETLAALRRFALKIGIMERLHFDSFEARLAVSKGDLQPAIRWTETHPVDMPAGYTFVWFELPIVIKTRVLIAQGTEASLHEAVQLLQELLTFAESMHSTYRQIETLAQTDDALQALERSVKLAQPGGFIRTFVDLGRPVAELLKQLAQRGVAPDYISQILDAFPQSPEIPKTVPKTVSDAQAELVEPLTERELEILQLLNERLTDKEIAQTLDISVLTAKTHARNIYQKLGVKGRRQAVDHAKTLGILSSN
jgi:LuxR family maltose regulon positive regulatory protein